MSEGSPPVANPDRDDLRIALRHGEEASGKRALSRLLSRYRRAVYGWCFRYVRDHELALEMSQEVFLRACRSYHRLDKDARFDAWLFIIARNRCLNEIRRPSLLTDHELDPEALPGSGLDPGHALEEKIQEAELRDLIQRTLDPLEQRALSLRCFERMPVDVITDTLGLDSASGARGLIQRARRKLRAALAERTDAEGKGHD